MSCSDDSLPSPPPKRRKTQTSRVWVWSLTIMPVRGPKEEEVTMETFQTLQPLLSSWMTTNCKKFVYQTERGKETKKLHFQGFLNLKEKKRKKPLITSISHHLGLSAQAVTVSPCSSAGRTTLAKYAMKAETRVAGPWADKPIYLGQDLFKVPRPWQKEVITMLSSSGSPDPRKIYWYYDPVGSAGKSALAKYLYYHHQLLTLTFSDAKDLLNLVFKRQGLKAYLFDLSRTKGGKTSMSDIYQALESVKNGYFINAKYETGVACFAIPHVVVFSNHLPDMSALSADRWVVRHLSKLPFVIADVDVA